jgi:competence protein ComEA
MLRKFSFLPAALAVLALVGVTSVLAAAEGTVNLNTASAEQLVLLPRVGETIAERILAFREANGPFKAVEELMLVEGIGERTFEQMRPHVALSGETSLAEKVRVASAEPEGE